MAKTSYSYWYLTSLRRIHRYGETGIILNLVRKNQPHRSCTSSRITIPSYAPASNITPNSSHILSSSASSTASSSTASSPTTSTGSISNSWNGDSGAGQAATMDYFYEVFLLLVCGVAIAVVALVMEYLYARLLIINSLISPTRLTKEYVYIRLLIVMF